MGRKKKMEDRNFIDDLTILVDKYNLDMTVYPDEVIINLETLEVEDEG